MQTVLSNTANFERVLFDPLMAPWQVVPLRVRAELGIISMKWYPTLIRSPGLESCYGIYFSATLRILSIFLGGYLLAGDTFSVQVRVDLSVMTTKKYPALRRYPEQEFHHQMYFSVIHRLPTFLGGGVPYLPAEDTIRVFWLLSKRQRESCLADNDRILVSVV